MIVRRLIKYAFIVLLILSCGAGMYYGLPLLADNENLPAEKSLVRPVKVMQLQPPQARHAREFPGTVQARSENKLSFRITGPLSELNAKIGQFFQKGDVIARIDPRDFRNHVKRIEAAIAATQANLKAMQRGARKEDLQALLAQQKSIRSNLADAEAQYNRYKQLLNKQMVPRADYDHVKAQYEATKAALEEIGQQIEKARKGAREEDIEAMQRQIDKLNVDLADAQNALEDTSLRAPFDGYLAKKFAENYETYEAGIPIVSFLDCSKLEVNVGIPEEFIPQHTRFQQFICSFDAVDDVTVEAQIKELGRQPDPITKTYPLTVHFPPDPNHEIRPGMAATLRIYINGTPKNPQRFVLPVEAVVSDSNTPSFVWIYDPSERIVVKRTVKTDRLVKGGIEITHGVSPQEWVVTAGAHFLEEGQQVTAIQTP
ncbi:efflux RND transporter periplasmic adaptor subunit [bacterium]|nr:efflux RND transporter periplasmic adaptor subunit [bacterium]